MGIDDTNYYWLERSRPVHIMTPGAFKIARTEITQAQQVVAMGKNS